MNKEIVDTLTKVHEFIEANKNINYKIRLLEREVPNIGELVKNLTIPVVSTRTCKTCRHRTKVQKEYEGKCIYNCLANGYEVHNEHKCDKWQPN